MAETDARERVKQCQEGVAARPDSAVAHLNLGTALLQVGHYTDAEKSLRRALEIDASLAEASVNLGGILLARWDFRGCVEANMKAAALRPEFLAAHFNQGLGHLYLGESEPMAACFRRVLELDPQHPAGNYYMAVALLALGHVDESQAHLDRAVALGFTPQPDFLKALEKARDGDVPVMEIG
jgi:protein O-GlcNAc transferase